MGFGLLLLGYLSVIGVLHYFIYYTWGIYIAIFGGLIMLAGLCRLQEYNIYFKATKYIGVAYVLILLGFSPFYVIYSSVTFSPAFLVISKIIRLGVLFPFHYFLLSGILSLAKEVENIKIARKAKRNIFITYLFFASFILEFLEEPAMIFVLFGFTFVYFFMMLMNIYSCYMRITYEGHDEAIDEKINAKNKNKNKNKNNRNNKNKKK